MHAVKDSEPYFNRKNIQAIQEMIDGYLAEGKSVLEILIILEAKQDTDPSWKPDIAKVKSKII